MTVTQEQAGTSKPAASAAVVRENALQRLVTAFICTGLLYMLLPGTFLGVWNLLAISSHHAAHSLSPAWIQAHGQAQIFGWIGTFIIGIGFYSLSKMGRLMPFAISRGWLSAVLQLAGFLVFFATVQKHRTPRELSGRPVKMEMWMRLVIASGPA